MTKTYTFSADKTVDFGAEFEVIAPTQAEAEEIAFKMLHNGLIDWQMLGTQHHEVNCETPDEEE